MVEMMHSITMIHTNRTLRVEEGEGIEDNFHTISMTRGDRIITIGAGIDSSMREEDHHLEGTTVNKGIGRTKIYKVDLIKRSSTVLEMLTSIEEEEEG